jgi:hypothetical protein
MIEQAGGPARPGGGVRQRVVLQTVELGQVSGSVIPSHRHGSVPYRGRGNVDYSCGRCERLLAIGAWPGTFQTVLLACGCGALNKVPGNTYARKNGLGVSPWAG